MSYLIEHTIEDVLVFAVDMRFAVQSDALAIDRNFTDRGGHRAH